MSMTASNQGRHDQIHLLKQGIDDLAASNFSDIEWLNRQLSSTLKKVSENQHFVTWRSATGSFASMPTKDIELRIMHKKPSQALLIIKLANPGPDAELFARQFWPDAEFTPSSPHSADAPSYWLIRQGGGLVSISHPHGDARITGISFDHMP